MLPKGATFNHYFHLSTSVLKKAWIFGNWVVPSILRLCSGCNGAFVYGDLFVILWGGYSNVKWTKEIMEQCSEWSFWSISEYSVFRTVEGKFMLLSCLTCNLWIPCCKKVRKNDMSESLPAKFTSKSLKRWI